MITKLSCLPGYVRDGVNDSLRETRPCFRAGALSLQYISAPREVNNSISRDVSIFRQNYRKNRKAKAEQNTGIIGANLSKICLFIVTIAIYA